MIKSLIAALRHPRALLDAWLAFPRYLGQIKPGLLSVAGNEAEAWLKCYGIALWPKRVQAPLGRRLLAISPHPDDEAIGAGGLLLAHRGIAELGIVTVFDGSGGGRLDGAPWQDTPEYKKKLVECRRAELARVASRLGASIVGHLDLPDGSSSVDMELAGKLAALVHSFKPDVVILPWLLDRLPDHRLVNLLWAWGLADYPCLVVGTEIWTRVQPTMIFDCSRQMEEKLALVGEYRSQLATADYLSLARSQASLRAFEYFDNGRRASAAEAFFALPNTEYSQLVQSMLGAPGQPRLDVLRLQPP